MQRNVLIRLQPLASMAVLLTSALVLSAEAQQPQVPEAGSRVPADQHAFVPLPIPGASSVALYGGTGSGLPTAMTSLLDPATYEVFPPIRMATGRWS
jgi:hypothetical protein